MNRQQLILAARENPRRAQKPCSVCGLTKSITEYHFGSSVIDGRSATCKPCANRRTRVWILLRVPTPVPLSEKYCPGCTRTLPASDYWRKSIDKTGLQAYCKDCHRFLIKGGNFQNRPRTRHVGSYEEGAW